MYGLRFFLVSALFTLPSFVFAQTAPDQAYQDTINKFIDIQQQQILQPSEVQKNALSNYLDVKINPQSPAPNVPVSISIESYLTDLYKATITWSLNGKVVLRGIGKTNFSFQNGASGKATRITLSLTTNTGETIVKDFSFTPVGATVLWEADTYTPPFYKGKPLMVPQANIKIVVVPDTENTNSAVSIKKLVYTWKKDDVVDISASGYSKNVYKFTGSKPLSNTKITLNVSSLDDTMQSDINIYLPQVRPFVLFYEKSPLLGTSYNKALDEQFSLNKKEFTINAEPYFFSNERGEAQTLVYKWSSNGKGLTNYSKNLTLRNEAGSTGTSLISLSMKSVPQNYQTATKDLKISFGEVPSTNRPTF